MNAAWLLPSDLTCDRGCHWAGGQGFVRAPECAIHAGAAFQNWRPRFEAWASFPFPDPGPLRRGVMLVMN